MRKSPIKKVSDKQAKDLIKRQVVKAKLMKLAPTDSAGRKLCPQCGELPDIKDGRGELHLCHDLPLSKGGRTSMVNCYLGCRACHNGPKGHKTECYEKPKPIDRIPALAGFTHGLHAISKEQQVGLKEKRNAQKKET